MLGSGMNLITTAIGFGMSTTFIVFICARLLCGRIRSAEARAAAAAAAVTTSTAYDLELQSEPDMQERSGNICLEPVVVASLPVIKYKKGALPSGEDVQCPICLGDYQEKEVLRIMPNCGHDFHLICIDAWLQKQSTCPICRLSLHDPNKQLKYSETETGSINPVANERSTQLFPSISENRHETAHMNFDNHERLPDGR
ncbi:putative Ring finger protein [Zostera marina]|uniref:Putative Ring finger protein n=1 Tax=Zostera marina TaxID=29655 RepID=A0A0K9PLD8_ZOSMR|nr:putative Ring finger protein [Zostera marina]